MFLPWSRPGWNLRLPKPSPRRFKLWLEQLETRVTPAVNFAPLTDATNAPDLSPVQLGDEQPPPAAEEIRIVEGTANLLAPLLPADQWARVFTDQLDYNPGATAIITGFGFQPSEHVTLLVVHTDGNNGGEGHTPWGVYADETGGFMTTWYVHPDDSGGATFDLSAIGDQGSVAQHTFTDAVTPPPQAPSISSVNIQSPTEGNPAEVFNSSNRNVTVDFRYTTSGAGTVTTLAEILNGSTVVASKSGTGTTGNNRQGSLTVTLPANLADDIFDVRVTVSISNAGGNGSRSDREDEAVWVDFTAPVSPSKPDLTSGSDTGASSSDNITRDETPSFTGTAEANSQVQIFANGTSLGTTQANGSGAWSFTTSPSKKLNDGVYQITAKATDQAGRQSVASQSLQIRIDTDGPNVTEQFSGGPSSTGWYNSTTGTLVYSYTASDSGGLDSPAQGSYTFGEGKNQSHEFTVFDLAGNASSVEHKHVWVDTEGPSVFHTLLGGGPANTGWYNNATGAPTHFYVASDSGSGLDSSSIGFYNFGDGENQSHTFIVEDEAGNITYATVENIDVDRVGPTITASVGAAAATGWYNIATGAPTVHFEASDATSGVTFVSGDVQLGEGENQSASGYAVDRAGNVSYASIHGLDVDLTAPMLSASTGVVPSESGWYNIASGAPTITYYAVDDLSGLLSVSSPVEVGEGENQSFTGYATDVAGNQGSVTVDNIDVDLTPPTITASPTRPPAETGWYNLSTGAPVINYYAIDELSGVLSVSSPVEVGEGKDQSFTGYAFDVAGNEASASIENIDVDLTPPTILAVADRTAGPTGWFNSNIGLPYILFEANDDLSGLYDVTPTIEVGEGADQSFTGYATDVAGNTASDTISNIDVDVTAPVVTALLNRPAGETGWYNLYTGAPIVSFIASDELSGVADVSPEVEMGEGADQSIGGSATDVAGNTGYGEMTGIYVDLTPPTISSSVDRDPGETGWYNLTTGAPLVTFEADDDLSGIAFVTDPVPVGEGGNQTIYGLAVDVAGNQATDFVEGLNVDVTPPTVTYTVDRPPSGTGWYDKTTGAPIVAFNAEDGSPSEGDGGGVITFFSSLEVAPIGGGHILLPPVSGSGSGVASVTAPVTVPEGENQTVQGTAFDVAGNRTDITTESFNVDLQDPTLEIVSILVNGEERDVAVATSVVGLTLAEGDEVVISFVFAHVPETETRTVTIDWGDGSEPVAGFETESGVFRHSDGHIYGSVSNYQLIVTAQNQHVVASQSIFVHVLETEEFEQVEETRTYVLPTDPNESTTVSPPALEDEEGQISLEIEIVLPPVTDANAPAPTLSIATYKTNPINPNGGVPLAGGVAAPELFIDIRTTNIPKDQGATLTAVFTYLANPGQENAGVPLYYNGAWLGVENANVQRTFAPAENNQILVTLTLTLTDASTPTAYAVSGTIFTVAVPAAPTMPVVASYTPPTTVAFAGLNAMPPPFATATFSSSNQLPLVLRVSQVNEISTSRSTASTSAPPADSGGSGEASGTVAGEGDLDPELRRGLNLRWLMRLLGLNEAEIPVPAGAGGEQQE